MDSVIVDAYLRIYSRAEIEAALRAALENHASGVTITSLSHEGGGSSGLLNGKTEDIIAILEACLARLDAEDDDGSEESSPVSHWNFARTRVGT